MADEKEKKKMIEKQFAEVNMHIRHALNQWADTMLLADADGWAFNLNYFPRDIMNAVMIFQHVCSNVGIKARRIDEEKAVEYGNRLRKLVMDMTGYDPHVEVEKMASELKEEEGGGA